MNKKVISINLSSLVHKFFPGINLDTKVDLHLHSQHSDSLHTISENIDGLRAVGVGVFSISDHYTVAGLPEAYEYAQKVGMSFIPATELSCLWKGRETHVLSYFSMNVLDKISAVAEENLIIKNDLDRRGISALGYSLTEYDAYQDDRTQGGWKFFHFLRDKGVVKREREAMAMRFQQVGVAAFPEPESLIRNVKKAGGITILAHPTFYAKGSDLLLEQELNQWLAWGIEGIEAYNSYLENPENYLYYFDFSRKNGLFVTAGSDFHGNSITPKRKLGVPMPSINRQITVRDLIVK